MASPAVPVAADQKASDSAAVGGSRAASIQRWSDRLKPLLSAALLPELIRVTAEYLLVGCRFGTRLTSKELVIEDADEDGYGRTLSSGKLSAWSLASCDEPLSDLADAQGVVRWSAQHMKGMNGTFGVGVPDPARLFTDSYGAGPQHWALYAQWSLWCTVHDNKPIERGSTPPVRTVWPPVAPIQFTADLLANRLTVIFESEPSVSAASQWVIDVPDLASKHIYFAMASNAKARLIVRG